MAPFVDPTTREPFETQITGSFRKWHTTPNFRDSKTYENASKKSVESFLIRRPLRWVAPNNALSTSKQNKTRKKKTCSLAGFLQLTAKKTPTCDGAILKCLPIGPQSGQWGRAHVEFRRFGCDGFTKKNSWGRGIYTLVNQHGNRKWTVWRCIPYWKRGFSIAMLVYRRVPPLFPKTCKCFIGTWETFEFSTFLSSVWRKQKLESQNIISFRSLIPISSQQPTRP